MRGIQTEDCSRVEVQSRLRSMWIGWRISDELDGSLLVELYVYAGLTSGKSFKVISALLGK